MLANLELYIDELVLYGFGSADRYDIAVAMQRELERLLAEQGVSVRTANAGEIKRLNGGTISVTPEDRPESVGARLAATLHAGLTR